MRNRVVASLVSAVLALLGTVVLVTYVRSLETRVAAEERPVQVLVVREQVAEQTPAEELAERVEATEIPARLAVQGSVASLDQLAGLVTTDDLLPGEQVVAGRFADPEALETGEVSVPEDLHQVTVALPAERALGGQVRAGDHVGVFVSFDEEPVVTRLLLRRVLVTAVQHSGAQPAAEAEEGNGASQAVPSGAVLVTLAAGSDHAERIVFAAEHATTWLSREPHDGSVDLTGGRTRETIYD